MSTFRSMMSLAAAAALALSVGAAFAQPGSGRGPGPGPGASAPGMGPGAGNRGGGPGMGRGARAGAGNTPGWAMMTAQERTEHQQRLAAMTSQGECKSYVAEHHEKMVARAKEKGRPMNGPRRDPCASLKP